MSLTLIFRLVGRPATIGCLLFLLGGALLWSGCSSKPSEPEGKEEVVQQINQGANGCIQLLSFSKTNGQESKVMDINVYRLDWKAEIEFTADCGWSGAFVATKGLPIKSGLDAFLPQNAGKTPVKKGSKKTITGTFRFEKTEKGWKLFESTT